MSNWNGGDPQASSANEPVWTYRGYQLKAGEFNTATVHLNRGELHRTMSGKVAPTAFVIVMPAQEVLGRGSNRCNPKLLPNRAPMLCQPKFNFTR